MQQIITQQNKWAKIFLKVTTILFIVGFLSYLITATLDINSNAEFAGFGAAYLFYVLFIPVLVLGIIQFIFFLFHRKKLSRADRIFASTIPILLFSGIFYSSIPSFSAFSKIVPGVLIIIFDIFLTILFLIFLKNIYLYKVKK